MNRHKKKKNSIISSISGYTKQTCAAPPPLSLIPQTKRQGGFLAPQTIKSMEKNNSTPTTSKKESIKATAFSITHLKPQIQEINKSHNITSPPITYDPLEIEIWLDNIANIAKCAKVEAQKTSKQTSQNCKRTIKISSSTKSKITKNHKRNFNHQNSTTLDCLVDK